jgi:hypothetical protein
MSARTVSTVAAAWLQAHRPEGFTGEIRAMHERESKERPLLVVIVDDGGRPHPKLATYTVTLRAEWRPAEDPAGLYPAAVNLLAYLFSQAQAQLRHDLAQQSLLLKKIVPGTDTEEPEGDTGRRLDWPFTLHVQTAL